MVVGWHYYYQAKRAGPFDPFWYKVSTCFDKHVGMISYRIISWSFSDLCWRSLTADVSSDGVLFSVAYNWSMAPPMNDNQLLCNPPTAIRHMDRLDLPSGVYQKKRLKQRLAVARGDPKRPKRNTSREANLDLRESFGKGLLWLPPFPKKAIRHLSAVSRETKTENSTVQETRPRPEMARTSAPHSTKGLSRQLAMHLSTVPSSTMKASINMIPGSNGSRKRKEDWYGRYLTPLGTQINKMSRNFVC